MNTDHPKAPDFSKQAPNKGFLYYPHLHQTHTGPEGRDTDITFFYIIEEEENQKFDQCKINEYCTVIGIIDDSESTYTNLICIAKCLDHEEIFSGCDRVSEASDWIRSKWNVEKQAFYPDSVHVVKTKKRIYIYDGNMHVASIGIFFDDKKNKPYVKYVRSEYHYKKFFFDHDNEPNYYMCDDPAENKKNADHAISTVINAYDPARGDEAAAKSSAKTAAFLGLPELKGTVKQRKWAEDIRAKFLNDCSESSAKKAARCTTAKWWIENRNNLSTKLK